MLAITEGCQRTLLTLATGTGKTFIAFQIAWKLAEGQPSVARLTERMLSQSIFDC